MIDLITRSRDANLYQRMMTSAKETACNPFESHVEVDTEHKPKCAETYNRLGKESKADILCFVQDDIEFLQDDWDVHLEEIFAEFKPDILGVAGSTKYEGGKLFDAGTEYGVGLIAGNHGVRILSPKARYTPCKVIDGMFMCVKRDFFLKEPFDRSFYGLFYWDIDLCLRSERVGVTSLLLKHSKPPELVGQYPVDMEPIEVFTPTLEVKWGYVSGIVRSQQCCMVPLEMFRREGQTQCFGLYREKHASAYA